MEVTDVRFEAPKAKTGSFIWALIAIIALVMVVPVWVMVRTAWGVATLSYEVTPTEIQITFGPDRVRIDRSSVTDVYIIERPTEGRRHFGTNLAGLKEGNWSFAETGRIKLYATSIQPLTVIETSDRTWGISPSEPEAFQQSVSVGRAGSFEPVPGTALSALVGITLLILLITAGLGVFIYYIVRVGRTITYELGPNAIVIRGGWRPVEIPYDTIAEVKVASPKGVPWRTFGMSLPGLHWGSYSWKSAGTNLRLYATRLRPLVLISAPYRTYGITPENPEHFIEELHKHLPTDRQ